jgi:hypothetical protein
VNRPAAPLRLRVEQGAHKGARVPLLEGRYTIGSGQDDDIWLSDEGIEPGHLVIEVDVERVKLRVMAAGASLSESSQALGPDDEVEWDAAMLTGPGCSIVLAGATFNLRREDGNDAGSHLRQSLPSWLARPVSAVHAAGGMCIAAAIVLGVVAVPALLQPAMPPAPAPQATDVQGTLSQREGWQQLRANAAPDGRLMLTGTVPNREALQEALHLPGLAGNEPTVKVVVRDELLRHVAQAIQDPQVQLDFDAADASRPPRLVARGTTRRPGLPSVLKLLKDEFRGRVEIVDETHYELSDMKTVKVELPVRIASVNVSEGYIETADGRKHFVGGAIGPDHTLESISDEKVTFKVAQRLIDFRLP